MLVSVGPREVASRRKKRAAVSRVLPGQRDAGLRRTMPPNRAEASGMLVSPDIPLMNFAHRCRCIGARGDIENDCY